jgi:hypothetical protein
VQDSCCKSKFDVGLHECFVPSMWDEQWEGIFCVKICDVCISEVVSLTGVGSRCFVGRYMHGPGFG